MKYHIANLDAGYVWAIVQEQVEAHTAQFPDRVGAIDADDIGGGDNGGVGDDDGDSDGVGDGDIDDDDGVGDADADADTNSDLQMEMVALMLVQTTDGCMLIKGRRIFQSVT